MCRQAKLLAPQRTILCSTASDTQVLGDRDALKQVLLILLDNARTHTPPQAVIRLSGSVRDGRASISVCDTGTGIAPNALPHIFERFYRVDTSRSRGGSGLGLPIAKELVEAQDGTLSVESNVGKGSTFTLTLPLAVT